MKSVYQINFSHFKVFPFIFALNCKIKWAQAKSVMNRCLETTKQYERPTNGKYCTASSTVSDQTIIRWWRHGSVMLQDNGLDLWFGNVRALGDFGWRTLLSICSPDSFLLHCIFEKTETCSGADKHDRNSHLSSKELFPLIKRKSELQSTNLWPIFIFIFSLRHCVHKTMWMVTFCLLTAPALFLWGPSL